MDNTLKPKGLFLVQLPPPIHGVSVFNKLIMESSVIRGAVDIDVIQLNTANSFDDIQKFRFQKIFKVIKTAATLFKKLLTKKYDFLYMTPSPTGLAFYRDLIYIGIAKVFRVRRIHHFHGQGYKNYRIGYKKLFLRWRLSKATVIVLSKTLLKDLAGYVKEDKCFIFPNALPLKVTNEEFSNIIKGRSIEKERTNFLFLSNILISKGALILLDSINILKSKYDFNVIFAGGWFTDGCQELFLNKIKNYGLERFVNLAGYCSGENKIKQFIKADVFIHPTLFDAFALVILEAMEFGLPVISTYEGAIPEIISEGLNGFLVPKNNPDLLAQAMEKLIINPDLRRAMGRESRRIFLEKYTFEDYEKQFAKFLSAFSKKQNQILGGYVRN